MIEGLFDSGSLPTLERLAQFSGQRHRVVMNNIANLSTPYYRPKDLSVDEFRKTLGEAIERRERSANPNGKLDIRDTRHLDFHRDGIVAEAEPSHENLMFHDRNDRSLEHEMQKLAENAMVYNASLQLMRNQFSLLASTIREQA